MQCQHYLGMCQGTQELGVRIIVLFIWNSVGNRKGHIWS